MDLAVIVLNWNTCALLEQCLRSIVCSASPIDMEVVVVDNASEDESRTMVVTSFPQVKLIANAVNLGFGRANNRAIPATTGRYILFLNSDTVVTPDALQVMVASADADPGIGILGPRLLNADGSLQYSCRRYPTLGAGFFRNTPLGRLFPHNRFAADYLMQDWDHSTQRDVDWVSGAALMIRRTLLEQIGGFDEDFYFYCEDVDLCWRANHTPPWRVTYAPQATVYHMVGRSSDKVPTRMTYEFHRSQYLFYRKHYARSTPVLIRPVIPVGIGLRAIGQMARYRFHYLQRRMAGNEPRRKPRATTKP